MSWFIGVDVGGTFTDFFAFDGTTGDYFVHKTPSTPESPGQAIINGLQAICQAQGIPLDRVARLAHGTTVATNALLQRRGGTVALITTEGFRDLLEIGRQTRPHMYSLQEDYPKPVIPRERRFEIAERVQADGSVLKPLTLETVQNAVDQVRAAGVEACAICLLFGFLNPSHERALAEAVRSAIPGLYISISSEVQPEFREYERLSTTVLNAYLQSVMDRYLGELSSRLDEIVPMLHIGINQSNGGLMSIERARRFPVRTALSGPAAGAVGAIYVARLAHRPNVITLDMGGTSADVALIQDYAISNSFDNEVGGFPVRLPILDINTVGAGGGSIARFDRDGGLKVGPVSAGAAPGPACYSSGGTEPTVTDANLLLGRLSPRGLLGGRMKLDREAALQVYTPVAKRLGLSLEHACHGVLAIVVSNMVRAIRAISIERGHDPRRCSLMAFGGAGPLHATDVARALGIREILLPPVPGILCAQGLVVSDLKENFVRSGRMPIEPYCLDAMRGKLAELFTEAECWFTAEAIPERDRMVELTLDMRYVGQNFELAVTLPNADLGQADELKRSFFAAHEANYGYSNPHDPVEVVNFRLTARGHLARPSDTEAAPTFRSTPREIEIRPVWFAADAPVETPVYDRAEFFPSFGLRGPAVIDQLDATTLLYPGDSLTVDTSLNLIIELAQ